MLTIIIMILSGFVGFVLAKTWEYNKPLAFLSGLIYFMFVIIISMCKAGIL